MKKISILTIGTILSLMFGLTACGEKVSNNLGGATRKNSTYDYVGNEYSYDYSAMGTNGQNANSLFDANLSNGAGYWDYYGITNGSANDSMRNDLSNGSNTSTMTNGLSNGYNTSTMTNGLYQNTPYNNVSNVTGTVNPANTALDSATIAD